MLFSQISPFLTSIKSGISWNRRNEWLELTRPSIRNRSYLRIVTSVNSIESENNSESTAVLIVGAGVVGLATSLALKKVGIQSLVLEKSQELRDGGAALSLWGNAWRALDSLGVADNLRLKFDPLKKLEISNVHGRLLRKIDFSDCTGGPHEVRGVQRGDLLSALSENLPSETIYFDSQIKSIHNDSHSNICVLLSNGKKYTAKVLVGCDGANSAIANWLGLPSVHSSGYSAYRGVASLPKGHPQLNSHNTIRMVWGKGIRVGMYPLTADKVYWFTCFNQTPGKREADPEKRKMDAIKMVKGWAFELESLIHYTPAESIAYSDISDRWLSPFQNFKQSDKNVTLAGDAAHPMTPNLGQGACTSLEDAIILAKELSKLKYTTGFEDNALITSALERYERERMIRCLPLQIRSNLMGVVLQSPNDIICYLRDNLGVKLATSESHFLDHTLYDCGRL